uniref:Uncharacterized protein n=1 Tax=Callorhinchus milii TaxID=7868 RepID=A0A4W3J536_CALMI
MGANEPSTVQSPTQAITINGSFIVRTTPVTTGTTPTSMAAAGTTATPAPVTSTTMTATATNASIPEVETTTSATMSAYGSYKRKDYVQVDYLINGMYADSDM